MVIAPLAENSLDLLSTAVRWWMSHERFAFVNLPWTVPVRYSAATRPPGARDVLTTHGAFVASGEQSFLQLWHERRLAESNTGYIGWTPCLRDESLDELHHFGFMKAELFVPLAPEEQAMDRVYWLLGRQLVLFSELACKLGTAAPALTIEKVSGDQLDIFLNDIEIGSYGARRFESLSYAYGTALALPRFTQALAHTERFTTH